MTTKKSRMCKFHICQTNTISGCQTDPTCRPAVTMYESDFRTMKDALKRIAKGGCELGCCEDSKFAMQSIARNALKQLEGKNETQG